MGNSLGSKKAAKIMKINGESFKLKTPVEAGEVVNDFPGHVLLDSEAVKNFGIRAKPLEPHHNLASKRLYFLVELPRKWKQGEPRRVRSGIQISAKETLENLMLSRRSASDLSITKKEESEKVRMKMKLPKAQVEKLKKESDSGAEFAQKIVALCLLNSPNGLIETQHLHYNSRNVGVEEGVKSHEKRVGFVGTKEGESPTTVASQGF